MVDNLNKIVPVISSPERVKRVQRRSQANQQNTSQEALKDKKDKKKKKRVLKKKMLSGNGIQASEDERNVDGDQSESGIRKSRVGCPPEKIIDIRV
jgi:hypothetical protein